MKTGVSSYMIFLELGGESLLHINEVATALRQVYEGSGLWRLQSYLRKIERITGN